MLRRNKEALAVVVRLLEKDLSTCSVRLVSPEYDSDGLALDFRGAGMDLQAKIVERIALLIQLCALMETNADIARPENICKTWSALRNPARYSEFYLSLRPAKSVLHTHSARCFEPHGTSEALLAAAKLTAMLHKHGYSFAGALSVALESLHDEGRKSWCLGWFDPPDVDLADAMECNAAITRLLRPWWVF